MKLPGLTAAEAAANLRANARQLGIPAAVVLRNIARAQQQLRPAHRPEDRP